MRDINKPNPAVAIGYGVLVFFILFFLCVFPPISFTILLAWMIDSIRD